MQIQILVFLENLIPVQRVLLGQRSAFFFHSPFPCTFIPSNQSASQSVTRNNTSSGTVLLHINRIHKSREPITNIPSIQRWGGQGGLEESRSSTRKLCTADSAGTEHNAYAPMSAFSLSLSLSLWDLPTNNTPPSLQRSLWCDRVQRIMMPMIMWNFWHYILTSASTAVTQRMNHPRLLHSLWDAGSWVGTTYSS